MVLEVMIENDSLETPSVEELVEWADRYGLTMPVLADANSVMDDYVGGDGSAVGLPYTVVIDRGVVIESSKSGTQENALEKLLE